MTKLRPVIRQENLLEVNFFITVCVIFATHTLDKAGLLVETNIDS